MLTKGVNPAIIFHRFMYQKIALVQLGKMNIYTGMYYIYLSEYGWKVRKYFPILEKYLLSNFDFFR